MIKISLKIKKRNLCDGLCTMVIATCLCREVYSPATQWLYGYACDLSSTWFDFVTGQNTTFYNIFDTNISNCRQ